MPDKKITIRGKEHDLETQLKKLSRALIELAGLQLADESTAQTSANKVPKQGGESSGPDGRVA